MLCLPHLHPQHLRNFRVLLLTFPNYFLPRKMHIIKHTLFIHILVNFIIRKYFFSFAVPLLILLLHCVAHELLRIDLKRVLQVGHLINSGLLLVGLGG